MSGHEPISRHPHLGGGAECVEIGERITVDEEQIRTGALDHTPAIAQPEGIRRR